MWPIDCIEHKRDGKVLTKEEITRFIDDYTAGRVADYQAAAWLMAVAPAALPIRRRSSWRRW